MWIAACVAGFCLSLAQAEIASAGSAALGAILPPYAFQPEAPGSPDYFLFEAWPAREPWTSRPSDPWMDDAPPPESMPLPPALLPAAVVLGWSILRSRRRRHV